MSTFWKQFIPDLGSRPKLGRYSRHLYQSQVGGGGASPYPATFEKLYTARGDHLTVHLVRSGVPLYVRLGVDENPFIRVREGMVLTQPFERFTVRVGNLRRMVPNLSAGFSSAVLYSSFGPLVQFPPKEYGFRSQFACHRNLVATNGGYSSIWSLWATAVGQADGEFPTVGKFGGTLVIKNTGSAGLLLRSGFAYSGATGTSGDRTWELGPGETLSLQLEENVLDSNDNTVLGGMLVSGNGADTTFQVMVSSAESDDATLDQAAIHVPPMG